MLRPAAVIAKNYLDRPFGFSNYKATGMIGTFPSRWLLFRVLSQGQAIQRDPGCVQLP
jgi:hypothetical protein